MAVLVIACPHALGLAISLVIAISATLGARNGLLVRDRRGLEEARNARAVPSGCIRPDRHHRRPGRALRMSAGNTRQTFVHFSRAVRLLGSITRQRREMVVDRRCLLDPSTA